MIAKTGKGNRGAFTLLLFSAAAIALSSSAVAADRDEVLRLRGEGAAAEGRCEEAIDLLEQARQLKPNERDALTIGKCQISLGSYADAVSTLRGSSESSGAIASEATLYSGIAKYHLGDFDAASKDLDRAVNAETR